MIELGFLVFVICWCGFWLYKSKQTPNTNDYSYEKVMEQILLEDDENV